MLNARELVEFEKKCDYLLSCLYRFNQIPYEARGWKEGVSRTDNDLYYHRSPVVPGLFKLFPNLHLTSEQALLMASRLWAEKLRDYCSEYSVILTNDLETAEGDMFADMICIIEKLDRACHQLDNIYNMSRLREVREEPLGQARDDRTGENESDISRDSEDEPDSYSEDDSSESFYEYQDGEELVDDLFDELTDEDWIPGDDGWEWAPDPVVVRHEQLHIATHQKVSQYTLLTTPKRA